MQSRKDRNKFYDWYRNFDVEEFFTALRKVVSTGKDAEKTWLEPKNSNWEKVARSRQNDNSSSQNTTEEYIKNFRAWLWEHRAEEADDWVWKKAVEMQMRQDKQVRIPHSKAVPKHEGMRKGYVTRYVPITRHLLPAITSTGRIYESKDAWTDNPMNFSSPNAEICERPGIYTMAPLDECDDHCVATDILTDGYLYMVTLEVLLLEDKTESQPPQRRCPGGVYFEDHCDISAMCIRQITHLTSPGEIWCNGGPEARNLPVISDGLWEARAAHATNQTRRREEKPPVAPQGQGLVFKNIREAMAKTLKNWLSGRKHIFRSKISNFQTVMRTRMRNLCTAAAPPASLVPRSVVSTHGD
jgi:hypothetical protein